MRLYFKHENILSLQFFGYSISVLISSLLNLDYPSVILFFRLIIILFSFYCLYGNNLISPEKPYLFWLVVLISLRVVYEIPNNYSLYQKDYYFYTYWFLFCLFVNFPLIFIKLNYKILLWSLKRYSLIFLILAFLVFIFKFDKVGRFRVEVDNEMYLNPIGLARCLVLSFLILFSFSNNKVLKIFSLLSFFLIFTTGTRIAIFPVIFYFVLTSFKGEFYINFFLILGILFYLSFSINEFIVFDRLVNRDLDQEVRLIQWSGIIQKLSDNYLFGYGLFDPVYNHLAHNIFLELVIILGIPLTLFFLYFFIKNSIKELRFLNLSFVIFGLTGLSIFMNPEVLALIFVNNGKIANK